MEICKRIFDILEENERNQKELADYIGVSPQTVHTWKIRQSDPPAKYIYAIADFLNVEIDYLLTGSCKDKCNFINSYPLKEDELRLLNFYSLLTDMEKGEIIGELKALTRGKKEEARIG